MNAQYNASRRHHPKLAALAGIALASAVSAAHAQPIETVVVTAPRTVHQTIVTGRASATGAPVEETTISRVVSYADLDLAKPADASELKSRVKVAAKDLCMELDKLYPREPKDPACERQAVDRTMVHVNILISDAQEKK